MQAIHAARPLSIPPASPPHHHKCCGRHCLRPYPLLFHAPPFHKPFLVAHARHGSHTSTNKAPKAGVEEETPLAADRLSTGTAHQTATVSATNRFPPPQSYGGSPLLWIGVGVAISLVFSLAAKRIQAYALQQAFKSVMQQSDPGNNQFGGIPPATSGSFPFPPAATKLTSPTASSPVLNVPSSIAPSYESKERVQDIDISHEVQETFEIKAKKLAFTDVDIDRLKENQLSLKAGPKESVVEHISSENIKVVDPEVSDGVGSSDQNTKGPSVTSTNGKPQSFMSVEMLEKMLDDPQVQKMVFPYLPEELRDPVTFKNMIQLPPVRQQLQDALNNMGGEFGPDMMKYMNNDVVKQQFEQLGLTPEEAVGKILANPDIAASLQNTRVVEAIMDCSQNPLNITKYQNDKEVMDALFKIAELFPGATSSPF